MNESSIPRGKPGMLPQSSEATRLLCASVFLHGSKFTNQVLSYLDDKNRGVAPELGVDLGLLGQLCQYSRKRRIRLEVKLFLCLILSLVVSIGNLDAAIVFIVILSTIFYFLKRYREMKTLDSSFRKGAFPNFALGEFMENLSPTLKSALPTAEQNLVVYTGFIPFVSAGVSLGGWSFIVDISKPSEKFGTSGNLLPFKVTEIYQAMDEALMGLKICGLETRDFFFVNGKDIRENRDILPDIYGRPVQKMNPDQINHYINDSDDRIRHYKWVRVHDWGQELVMSFFVRFMIHGKNMFVEVNRFLLTPIQEQYRGIDSLRPFDGQGKANVLLESFIIGPLYALFSPLFLFQRITETMGRHHEESLRKQKISKETLFDYGVGQGYRQLCSSGEFRHFFQKIDGDFYAKVLEKATIEFVIGFLECHGIDTSDIRERQTVIMNSGILVQGGDVSAESLAVGAGAQAVKTKLPKGKAGRKGEKK